MPDGLNDLQKLELSSSPATIILLKALQKQLSSLLEKAKKDRFKQAEATRKQHLLNEPHYKSAY